MPTWEMAEKKQADTFRIFVQEVFEKRQTPHEQNIKETLTQRKKTPPLFTRFFLL